MEKADNIFDFWHVHSVYVASHLIENDEVSAMNEDEDLLWIKFVGNEEIRIAWDMVLLVFGYPTSSCYTASQHNVAKSKECNDRELYCTSYYSSLHNV